MLNRFLMADPCPKCGGVVLIYPHEFGSYRGQCEDCGSDWQLVLGMSGLQYSAQVEEREVGPMH